MQFLLLKMLQYFTHHWRHLNTCSLLCLVCQVWKMCRNQAQDHNGQNTFSKSCLWYTCQCQWLSLLIYWLPWWAILTSESRHSRISNGSMVWPNWSATCIAPPLPPHPSISWLLGSCTCYSSASRKVSFMW